MVSRSTTWCRGSHRTSARFGGSDCIRLIRTDRLQGAPTTPQTWTDCRGRLPGTCRPDAERSIAIEAVDQVLNELDPVRIEDHERDVANGTPRRQEQGLGVPAMPMPPGHGTAAGRLLRRGAARNGPGHCPRHDCPARTPHAGRQRTSGSDGTPRSLLIAEGFRADITASRVDRDTT